MWKYLIIACLFTLSPSALNWAESSPEQSPLIKPESQASALPATLPPDMFTGKIRQAYQVAADIPEVLVELNCHCGCDKSQGHQNLLDCFSDDHAVG